MSMVTLVSGGLDSSLMALLGAEQGILQHPLFINYGQRSRDIELSACRRVLSKYGLPEPQVIDVRDYGAVISSGITDPRKRLYEDAFLPGRNLLFLLIGAAYAVQVEAQAVAIGLLSEEYALFPDQSAAFVKAAESLLRRAMGRNISVLTPLMGFNKGEVMRLARQRGIEGTRSCHSSADAPCGECVACRQYEGWEV